MHSSSTSSSRVPERTSAYNLTLGVGILFLTTLLLVSAYVHFSTRVLASVMGPSTEKQISRSFLHALNRDYDILVVGNSRIYRGVNPDHMPASAYNFAHDNDSFNQIYHKLLLLDAQGVKYETLVLGVDYFQFAVFSNSRNYVYGRLLGKDYLHDYKPFKPSFFKPLDDAAFNEYMDLKFTKTFLTAARILLTDATPGTIPSLNDNGQYKGVQGTAQKTDSIIRSWHRLPIQEAYFMKILDFSRENGLKLFLVMPPLRKNELLNYPATVLSDYDKFFHESAKSVGGRYLNYAQDSRFGDKDFVDITHLSVTSADRFTGVLANDMEKP